LLNQRLSLLHPYPFERLRQSLADVTPNASLAPVNLSIGEPRHPTPQFIKDALVSGLGGLSNYPPTAGSIELRESIAGWLRRRFALPAIDPATQVLPVNGSREALFALTQTIVDPRAGKPGPIVVCPNPFYQIYEGAALLAGAQLYYTQQSAATGFRCDWSSVPAEIWSRCALLFVCSPGNPTGAVMSIGEWQQLFELSDRYGFVIASDECYSEIYFDEQRPPLGSLQAAQQSGRPDFRRLIAFGSLSKRSNCPGLRSGYVAGDAALIRPFLLYRTYHGCAMSPPVQAASIAAWNDETHVAENRRLYREKFAAVAPRLASVLDTAQPEAGFYLWAGVPEGDDVGFVRELYRQYNVLGLPGSYLARDGDGQNPGRGYVRLAMVEPLQACVEGCRRIERFVGNHGKP
jgi:N-succinyldiaminopimelate aminotransferase